MCYMNKIQFSHEFEINEHGIPWSDNNRKGSVNISNSQDGKQVSISGDKEGLLCLAKKLIEVAHCDVVGYHKHIDEVEAENIQTTPTGLEVAVGKLVD